MLSTASSLRLNVSEKIVLAGRRRGRQAIVRVIWQIRLKLGNFKKSIGQSFSLGELTTATARLCRFLLDACLITPGGPSSALTSSTVPS